MACAMSEIASVVDSCCEVNSCHARGLVERKRVRYIGLSNFNPPSGVSDGDEVLADNCYYNNSRTTDMIIVLLHRHVCASPRSLPGNYLQLEGPYRPAYSCSYSCSYPCTHSRHDYPRGLLVPRLLRRQHQGPCTLRRCL